MLSAAIVFFGLMSGGGEPVTVETAISCHEVVRINAEAASPVPVAVPQDGAKKCERPSKDNPEVGESDPNKVGCTCERTCVNGYVQESTEPGKRCKNHCKKSECGCPDPCKT